MIAILITAFLHQFSDIKRNRWLLYTNSVQLMTHAAVLYKAAYLAIMLPSLLAYCRG